MGSATSDPTKHMFNVFVDAPDRPTALKALALAIAEGNKRAIQTGCHIGVMISPEERNIIPDGMRKP